MRAGKVPNKKQEWGKRKEGEEIRLLPSNPLSLYNMLNLRLAAYKSGNAGLRKEIISISDLLLRQKAIKKSDYKKITVML